ncbi:outer membrane beta-barrel protein [Viscerimonas tarda]
MKKLIMTLAVALGVFAAATAQETGEIWVSGNFGISSISVKGGDDYFGYKFIPEVGYIINDQIALGLGIGISQTEFNFEELKAVRKLQAVTVSPFIRYSVSKGDIGGIFVDAGIDYTKYKSRDTDLWGIGLKPGVALNVSDRVQLTAKVGFLGYELSKIRDEKTSRFGLDLNLSRALFGVELIF